MRIIYAFRHYNNNNNNKRLFLDLFAVHTGKKRFLEKVWKFENSRELAWNNLKSAEM
jgi:hypothetical protein